MVANRRISPDAVQGATERNSAMSIEIERNLGEQPVVHIMERHGLSAHDLVAASTEHLTHKMVSRARKGRRLTPNVQQKVLNAVNAATGGEYVRADLFNYE